MASHKEEPNTSSLFGDSPADDPFSQLQQQQQHPASEPPAKNDDTQVKQPAVSTAQEQQPKAVVGDASSLFGNSGDGNADLFFSSTNATAHATPQSTHPPLATNASAASFFDQPPPAATTATTNSFFDDLGQQHSATGLAPSYSQESQQHSTNPASNLTQAYDPATYNSYDYSQQPALQGQDQQQQQQQYDQTQWIQFDPNQHYYYDDQGQVHYYDPNTNQEYDMSQYGYDQQGQQTYDYQYDPQYADYYAQQGYDPNAYTATATGANEQQQQAYAPVQDNYDPNAYAPTAATLQPSEPATAAAAAASDPQYYQPNDYAAQQADYSSQSYAPVHANAVAEVPAQVQSEQTIDTQHYATEQQQDPYGLQSYPAVDASAATAETDQQQQMDYSYSSYDPNTAPVATSEFEQGHYGNDAYAPVDLNNTNYASIQADFEAEDLQQSQAPPPTAASRDVGPPPPPPAGPHKQVVSPPPASSTVISPPPPPQTNTPPAALSSHGESIDANEAPESFEQHEEASEEDLNDLDDLVLGGSGSQQQDLLSDKMDRLAVADDAYDNDATTEQSGNVDAASSHQDQNVPETEIKTEPTVFASVLSVDEPREIKEKEASKSVQEESHIKDTNENEAEAEKPAEASQEASHFSPLSSEDHTHTSPSQQVPDQNEQVISYEQDHSASYDFNYGYEPTPQSTENAYEPSQAVGFESQPVTGYEPTTGYEPQQASAYEPEQVASYEPTSTYEPTASYEPQQQNDTYAPQEMNYEPQQTSGYQPTSYEPQSNNAYDPAHTTTGGYEPQQYSGYEPTAPATQYGAPPPAAATTSTAPERNMTSPPPPPPAGPPRAGSIKSVASPPPGMQAYYPQRANSITEPDRRHHSSSPFAGYYGNNTGMNPQYPVMERSATVPPPMTERMASPRPQLIPCPDRLCEGENKPKAKFCCECGRPLAGISRSTTPSAMSPSAYNAVGMDGFSPMSTAVFGAVGAEPVQRTALDDKKDAMVASLKQFVESSVVVQSDLDQDEKRRRAMAYIDSRLASFDAGKALLWRVVQVMLEHSACVLGDGGELDKAIIALVSSSAQDSSASSEGLLDQLEAYLNKGDREGACQFANDHDMWAHSLVIASSVDGDLFKKTVTQFIQRELFSAETELAPQVPGDKKALRMLYSVFNGAGADAVSEYAKTSAHADAVYTDETLQEWQSALALILANRSANDQAAIQGLGDRLKHLNKDNEARLCYLLSPDVSGLDNSKMIGDDLYSDLDALYLAELYEFASKASIQQDFKLVLAWWLKDLGFSEESQKYTEAIGAKLVDASGLDTLRHLGDISSEAQSR
ncbi:Sec23-binding domain of Sec16-domain-containing protein [Mucor lusitanicus]|uniref:COPII coat assembly protein SEC16 n=1 Tax=Mucor circinelloides f. lusitanicus TaxID=29924 RepID=A0A8H4F549_MUCCL|nr:Sec23-binding domain of Sec16-domain-containing protein [Mucor lusitanicus]